MAAVTVADGLRSVVWAEPRTLVIGCIPAPELQRHHRRNIPPPTSLQKTGWSGRMTVPTRADNHPLTGGETCG